MYIKIKYPLSDNYENFLAVEADVIEENGIGWADTVVDLCRVELNGIMGIKTTEIPDDLKNELEEQCRKQYQTKLSTPRNTGRMRRLHASLQSKAGQ